MGTTRTRAVVLDAGALIAFERRDARMRALVRQALESGTKLVVPAGVLAQVFRNPSEQVPLRALTSGPASTVPALDRPLAEAAGVLCGRSGTSDIVDASVVLVARRERAVVVTSDVADLKRLDPALPVTRI